MANDTLTPDELTIYRARRLVYTASNGMSMMRLLMAAPMAWALWNHSRSVAVGIAVAAAVTDMLDGHLARRLRQESELGKVLDPIADKVFVAVTVIVLVLRGDLALWVAAVVLARDIAILAAGIVVKRRTGLVLPSNAAGKGAVLVLSAYLLLLILGVTGIAITIALGVALALLLLSTVLYARRAAQVLRQRGRDQKSGVRNQESTVVEEQETQG